MFMIISWHLVSSNSIISNDNPLLDEIFNSKLAIGFIDKNKITTDDQIGAIQKAQDKMIERVTENRGLFERAERVARDTIENYFNQINEISGTKFRIEWR